MCIIRVEAFYKILSKSFFKKKSQQKAETKDIDE